MKPFFRADQVGSLLRPAGLLAARAQFKAGRITASALRAAEDEAVQAIARRQEEAGLEAIVDGEFRRENWWIDFVASLRGVEIRDGDTRQAFIDHDDAGGDDDGHSGHGHAPHYVPKNVVTTGKLGSDARMLAADYAALAACTARTAKITLPSPARLHFHGGRAAVSTQAYPDMEAFFADLAALYQREIAALEAAGCRYIQIDDPLMSYFISDRLRAEVRAAGDDPDRRLARYVALINECIAKRRPDTAVAVHVCRGNARSAWITEGGYERIAEAVLGGLEADHLLLEYDDARSGGFDPLRHIPGTQRVVLGLITTKTGALEDADALARRIDEAARHVSLDRLAISPQCGFASVVEGNLISEEMQWAKLRLTVEVARRVWGTAGR